MNTKDIVYIALFAAFIAALGVFPPLTVPIIAVSITAQTLGVMLAGGILGAKRGALSIVLFLILLVVGLPLLSGGRGGLAVFGTRSGGFLLGWIVGAYVVGFIVEKNWHNLNFFSAMTAGVIGGMVVVYLFGIPWIAVVAQISFLEAFIGSMAFVPGDLIKAVIAATVILIVKKSYPLITR